MKKIKFLSILLTICLCIGALTPAAAAIESVPAVKSTAVYLVDEDSGHVYYEQYSDRKVYPASLTKIMTAMLAIEAVERGEVSLDDPVTALPGYDFDMEEDGSTSGILEGETMRLEELLYCTLMASANEACNIVAMYICGSVDAFVARMNERAQELGMTDTVYVNCTGLPVQGQHTTARDVALLSCEMCTHLEYFSYGAVWMDTLTHPSGRVTDLTNTNRLVRFYEGCDGLKTGSADDSKYCLSCTAEKNGMRLIAIVLGASASQTRFNEARAMLDYGFSSYKRVTVLQKGDRLGQQVKVHLGMQDEVDAAAGSGLSMLMKLGQEKQLSLEVELPEEVEAPLKAGDALGLIRVKLGGRVVARLAAVAAEDVGMPGLVEGFLRVLTNWR